VDTGAPARAERSFPPDFGGAFAVKTCENYPVSCLSTCKMSRGAERIFIKFGTGVFYADFFTYCSFTSHEDLRVLCSVRISVVWRFSQ
jgi:hypothetical protein